MAIGHQDENERLVALAGSRWSFALSRQRLEEFCGLRVSGQTIRRVTDQAGREAVVWRRRSSEATEAFRRAPGQTEFFTDGTLVNTVGGWREMRSGVFAKREPGSAAAPAEARTWADTQTDPLGVEGPMRLLHALEAERRPTRSPKQRPAIDALVKYERPRLDGLGHRDRLRAGLPIGSGLIEGGRTTLVGPRLKKNRPR